MQAEVERGDAFLAEVVSASVTARVPGVIPLALTVDYLPPRQWRGKVLLRRTQPGCLPMFKIRGNA